MSSLYKSTFLKHVAERCVKPDSETMLCLLRFLDSIPFFPCVTLVPFRTLIQIVLNKTGQFICNQEKSDIFIRLA